MTFNALVINNITSRVVPATGNIVNDCTFTNDPIGVALFSFNCVRADIKSRFLLTYSSN